MKIISLKFKNYKDLPDLKILFDNTGKNDIDYSIGTSESIKKSLIDSILWCLYEYKDNNDIIINNQKINIIKNESVEVQVEITFENNDKRYTITRSQIYYSLLDCKNSIVNIKCLDLSNNEFCIFYNNYKIINDILPEYILKYLIIDDIESHYNLCINSSSVILEFIQSLKHENQINCPKSEFLKFMNKYIMYFFSNICKKFYLKVHIDESFNLHIMDKEKKEYVGSFLNYEIRVCASLALIFTMIKIYENYRNVKTFIIIKEPINYLDTECRIRLKRILTSKFFQIVYL